MLPGVAHTALSANKNNLPFIAFATGLKVPIDPLSKVAAIPKFDKAAGLVTRFAQDRA